MTQLRIDKLVYGGEGLARTTEDGASSGKTVFVPYVLPAEVVDASIVDAKPGFSRARLERVIEPSASRIEAPCPYFERCGGCHYQHVRYDEQLQLKAEILRETLRRTAKLELDCEIARHASPPFEYRNRTRFHVRTQPELVIGYFRHGSHELLAVRECPISSPLINRVLRELWETNVPGVIAEIELFADARDQKLLIELYLRAGIDDRGPLLQFAQELGSRIAELHGVVAFAPVAPHKPRNAPPSLRSDLLYGQAALEYEAGGFTYRVSAGAFFQTNRYVTEKTIEIVAAEHRGKRALDLYSGVGLFAVPLARQFERVVAVESSPVSAADLRHNVPANVKVSSQSTEAYLTSAAGDFKPDLVVVDPPRAGLGSTVCAQISRLSTKEIVYVSCDPATLARDLKQFATDGWAVREMHLIDLFPQTFHIESITVLKRP
jgi:23S rRNA (uracil1939-C5)-methyltransferase